MEHRTVTLNGIVFTVAYNNKWVWTEWVRYHYQPHFYDDENYEYKHYVPYPADWKRPQTDQETENYRNLAGYGGEDYEGTPCRTDSCGYTDPAGYWVCNGSCKNFINESG